MVGLSNDISIMPDLHYPSQGSIIICNYPWQPSWLIPKLQTNTSSLISSAKFGFMMFMAIHSLRPNINSLRVQLLVEWVVVLHVKRSFCSLWLNIFFSFLILFIEFLKIWTVLSACPFNAEWYGAVWICWISFFWRNFSNFKLVNKL